MKHIFSTTIIMIPLLITGCPQAQNQSEFDLESAYFEQAQAQFDSDDFASAEESYSKGIELLDARDREAIWSAYGMRGLCRYMTGAYRDGIDDTTKALEAAIGLAPDDIIARMYYQRGMFYRALNNPEKQLADFEKAYRYDPELNHEPKID